MAKSKEKETGQTKSKAKPSKSPKPSKPSKSSSKPTTISQEFVVDSDDEDAAPEARKVKKVNSDITPKPTKKTKVPPPPKASSSEESSEDDSDSEDAADKLAVKPASKETPKTNGVKRKAESQSSSEDDSSEEEDSNEEPPAKRTKPITTTKDDGSSASDDDELPEPTAAPSHPTPSAQPSSSTASAIPARAFEAPSGYETLAPNLRPTLNPSDLKGKRIFHITAPKSVPIHTLLKSIPASVLTAKPSTNAPTILTHNSTPYTFSTDDSSTYSTHMLFLPDTKTHPPSYAPSPSTQITRTLHLQQKVSLPFSTDTNSRAGTGVGVNKGSSGDIAIPAVSSIRPQPKGLRMRFRPVGVVGKVGGLAIPSDDEESREQETRKAGGFQFPRSRGGASEEVGGGKKKVVEATGKDKVKKKKSYKGLENPEDMIPPPSAQRPKVLSHDDVGGADGDVVEKLKEREKKVKKEKRKKGELGEGNVVMGGTQEEVSSQVNGGDGGKKESKEEKAKRKEEKRARKEAKRKGEGASSE